MYNHILIPTDGSPASVRAGKAGVEFARSLGARVTAFFAAPAPTPVVYEGLLPVAYMSPDEHAQIIARAAAKYLGDIEREARAAGVPCASVHVTSDFPADAIVATAKRLKCDAIFMASHGRRGLSGVLLGSETQKVLTHSKVPVIVHR